MNVPDGYMNNDLMPLNGGSSEDYVFSVLRIMTKEEWRKMRNKYLNLQTAILTFAMYMCYPPLQMWNFFVLTESLFLSLTIIFISVFFL